MKFFLLYVLLLAECISVSSFCPAFTDSFAFDPKHQKKKAELSSSHPTYLFQWSTQNRVGRVFGTSLGYKSEEEKDDALSVDVSDVADDGVVDVADDVANGADDNGGTSEDAASDNSTTIQAAGIDEGMIENELFEGETALLKEVEAKLKEEERLAEKLRLEVERNIETEKKLAKELRQIEKSRLAKEAIIVKQASLPEKVRLAKLQEDARLQDEARLAAVRAYKEKKEKEGARAWWDNAYGHFKPSSRGNSGMG